MTSTKYCMQIFQNKLQDKNIPLAAMGDKDDFDITWIS